MLQVILFIINFYMFTEVDCVKHNSNLMPLEIRGTIKSIIIEENQQFIIFEINSNDKHTHIFKLINNTNSHEIYKYAKVGDSFQKNKNSLRIYIARCITSEHVTVRHFDVTCDTAS